MMKIDVSPRAYQDLTDIKLYISNKLANPDAAKKILTDIIDALHSLTEMPNRGTKLKNDLVTNSNYRFIPCHNYLIFYQVTDKSIFVSRILYKSRNLLSFFK